MATPTLLVHIAYTAQPDQAALARQELTALITTVVAREPACLGIQLLQDSTDPTRLLLLEQWTDQEAYTGPHMQTAHIQDFIRRAPAFLAGPPAITFWHQLEERRAVS